MSKVCRTCGVSKPFDSFTKHKRHKDGHVLDCKPCLAEKARQYRQENLEAVRKYEREYKKRTYEKRGETEYKRKRYWSDPDLHRAKSRMYYNSNPEPYLRSARVRGKRIKAATPSWLTSTQEEAIMGMYALRDRLSEVFSTEYEVDHIIPLKGEYVCGLHVPWNLQILEKSLNRAKSNKLKEQTTILTEVIYDGV